VEGAEEVDVGEERGGDNNDGNGKVVARFTARTFQIVLSRLLQTHI
jgi:hypothetical protein